MIVVKTRNFVYGPFESANQALAWTQKAWNVVRTDEWPLVIDQMEPPTDICPLPAEGDGPS